VRTKRPESCSKCGAREIREWSNGQCWCGRCAWTWPGVEDGDYTGEGCSTGEDGLLHDGWFHDEILDNPEADLYCARQTLKRFIEDYGWDEKFARQMVGLKEADPKKEAEGR
jgi:hypothetical protein